MNGIYTKLENRQLGAYKLISPLGKGGVAEVWLANQLVLNRQVALKLITETPEQVGGRQLVERFKREGQALARLDHPNILPIIDYGSADGFLYLVTPYVRGGSLDERLERETLTRAQAFGLFEQVLNGLEFAHQHGIIHRDLKPGNILLYPDGRAVIADFGIAKIENENLALTQSGVILGSPDYMAPEQFMGCAEYRSDLYSLGGLLYQLLTGRVPYWGASPYEVGIRHLKDPLPLPHKLVPAALEAFVTKALQKRPDDRFANASEMKGAFQRARSLLPPAELGVRPPMLRAGQVTSSSPTKIVQSELSEKLDTLPDPSQKNSSMRLPAPARSKVKPQVAVTASSVQLPPLAEALAPIRPRAKGLPWLFMLLIGAFLLLAVGSAVGFAVLTSNSETQAAAVASPTPARSVTVSSGSVVTPATTTRSTSATSTVAVTTASKPATATPAATTRPQTGRNLTVTLESANGTAARGTATITDRGNGKTAIELKMSALGQGRHDVFIRQGSCQTEDNINNKYQLPTLEVGANGEASATVTLEADFAKLFVEKHYISVLNHPNNFFHTASCGDIGPAVSAQSSQAPLLAFNFQPLQTSAEAAL